MKHIKIVRAIELEARVAMFTCPTTDDLNENWELTDNDMTPLPESDEFVNAVKQIISSNKIIIKTLEKYGY